MADVCRFVLHIVGSDKKAIVDFCDAISSPTTPCLYRTWNVSGYGNMSVKGQLAKQNATDGVLFSADVEGVVAWTMENWFNCGGFMSMPDLCRKFHVGVEAFSYDADSLDRQEHFSVDQFGQEIEPFSSLPWSPKMIRRRSPFGGVETAFNGRPQDGDGGFCREWQKWKINQRKDNG